METEKQHVIFFLKHCMILFSLEFPFTECVWTQMGDILWLNQYEELVEEKDGLDHNKMVTICHEASRL